MREGKTTVEVLAEIPPWEWPEDAGQALLELLRDDGASGADRLLAAELAGNLVVINDELVDALLSILGGAGETQALRGQAAISLGPVLEQADTDGFEDPDDVPIAERTFHRIQQTLRALYVDAGVPSDVRRAILEAAVRAPQSWHRDAVRAAYGSGDEAWRLTAVFCMRFVRGFDEQILEALDSENSEIHYEAVRAAGAGEVSAAWPHVSGLVTAENIDKPLLLAAIEAVASIRPREAAEVLSDLLDSDDEDIADAVSEAMALAEMPLDEGDEDGEPRP